MSAPVLPGATLGILGGGQLGRMTAMAARSLGYRVEALDPDPSCAARFVVERCITATFDDAAAAASLARQCDVVTLEIEKVALASLEAVERITPMRPGPRVLAVIQDRARQKDWLAANGFPVGAYRTVATGDALAPAFTALGASRAFVKSCTGGYDGRGQFELESASDSATAWHALGDAPVVVEAALDIALEASVLVARSPRGELAVYAPALNHHEHRILAWSALPGPLAPAVAAEMTAIARAIAERIAVEGLLVVEFFVLRDGTVLVNELAPRPHNSFHATEVACLTSQFEQLVRAVCDLPLGATDVVRPAAIVNLLGDLWLGASPPAFAAALAIPGVRLHLYGKRDARPGRKMGHLSATGSSPEDAVERVLRARAALGGVAPGR